MAMTSVKLKGTSCFTGDWCGFDEFKLINIIIGRNNTGKSQLLSLVQMLCIADRARHRPKEELMFSAVMEEAHLRGTFHESNSSRAANGNYWFDNGLRFVDTPVGWIYDQHGAINITSMSPKKIDRQGRSSAYLINDFAKQALQSSLVHVPYVFGGKVFRHLLADRDIQKEPAEATLALEPDGRGATNIIRSYLINAERIGTTERLIQQDLRSALNEVFGPDGHFTRISVQLHDMRDWEIFLEEERKGLIALSRSGSGLKTVILVLLSLLVIPDIDQKDPGEYVYAFEELENNLHPSLLRRLLSYIESFAIKHKCPIFLTTHSAATLDQFRRADHAQFVRVSHDGQHASTQTISAHFDHSQVVGELGARASDILQANGIIWVEGPSDAIYLDHWIEIFSEGRLIEGRDYACAFYGGSLLARTDFSVPGEQDDGLVNLIPLNRNVALVCDSDRTRKNGPLKPRVLKAKAAIDDIPNALMWVTAGKEIESYLPGSVIGAALGLGARADPGQFDLFFPSQSKSSAGKSYVEVALGLNAVDKVNLALSAREHVTVDVMAERLDWKEKMDKLVKVIQKWNA
ncbi:AAA family ATPase [Xanthomonas translucens]|uniref:AAA family ATPase n=1 Tax=Xanthomonas campestris pv. translucens TaxID=343 RepID=UPI00272BE9DB|nr:AAA family ATPase [Xanthomonas translucens]WLA11597.1 AAA family ATPase [Xanthomonas translucens]